jgi:pimeloyl-ACP methyl ester carboxylesterase
MVHYRTAETGAHRVFYREAGRPDNPAILLLHGFPTSSHMFRELIPTLAERYFVIAPDLPASATPSRRRAESLRTPSRTLQT